MRVRVWQVISELKEEAAVILQQCKELKLPVTGRFSLLTQREAELLRDAIARFRKDEQEKQKASRAIRYAPGFSPDEIKKKEEEDKRRKAAAKKTASAKKPSEPQPAQQPSAPAPAAPAAESKKKTYKDEKKVREAPKKDKGKRTDVRADEEGETPEFTGTASLPGIHRLSRGVKHKKVAKVVPTGKVEVQVPITIRDLSQELGVKANDIIGKLFKRGRMLTLNSVVGEEDVLMIALDFNREVEIRKEKVASDLISEMQRKVASRVGKGVVRAPIVTFLGHVDHGKTSLLDKIRKANVAGGEAGGITQHIGAYRVDDDERGIHITFLDTPGHEAFTALRARGASVTDIAVLVVAADDGVMPQTVEAINHAKAANVPIIVAINKIDKPSADQMRVKQTLMNYDLVPEEWGGPIICVPVSALTGEGIDTLLEMIMLVAEVSELSCHTDIPAKGVVIEAQKNEQRGATVTLLVQDGTIHVGDCIVAGTAYTRIRSLLDWNGKTINEAGPSHPVVVFGLSDVPNAGEQFVAVKTLDMAKQIAEERITEARNKSLMAKKTVTLENFLKGKTDESKELAVVLKTDVIGTREVLETTLKKSSTAKARVNIVHAAVGGVNIADVQLADASKAIIICFGVVPETKAKALADQMGVEIRTYNIIYDLIDDIRNSLQGLLEPIRTEVVTGRAEVKQAFKISKVGTIAGCIVRSGTISRNEKARVIRDSVVIHTGSIDDLKRFKDDVREVKEGFECGLKLATFDDIHEGDVIESFKIELTYPALD